MHLDYEAPDTHRFWRRWHRRRLARRLVWPGLVLLLVLLLLALWVTYPGIFYFHWDEVDIHSGRIRRSDYVLSIRVRQTIEASSLSRELAVLKQDAGEPDWRTVNTFEGTHRVSPNYMYHGAIYQMRLLEQVWQLIAFTPEARRQVAATVLDLWQTGRGDDQAYRYIQAVAEVAWEVKDSGRPVDVADLPEPRAP
jgi:hypothetical protein